MRNISRRTRSGSRRVRTAMRSALVLAALVIAVPRAGFAGGADPETPMAVGAKLDRSGATTQLSFDLSSAVEAKATPFEGPDRIVIDLPRVNFQIDPAVGRLKATAGDLIKSFRFGLFAPGRSRIVIDLAAPATLQHVGVTSIAGSDPSRLTIELVRSDRAAFHKATEAAAAAEPPPIPAPALKVEATDAAATTALPVVIVDPGHGGIDPGAKGLGGVVEKTITFDFATMLADKLNASGRYRAILTRKDDSFVSLGDRVAMARDSNAALFISVHADTIAANAGVTGATVYICSDRASDAEAERVAATENNADAAAGVPAAPETSGVNDILFDLTRRETRTYAHLFQRTLVGYWQKIARLNKNPERAAGFKVLQAPDVPSVLLELGYLSSDKDVKAMTSPDWRDHATTSILASVDAFFAPRRAVPVPAAATVAAAPVAGASPAN